jgi:hypothetical protein
LLALALDVLVRAWRIQLAAWTAGGALRFWPAVRLNLYGEAASTLTPNRLGGEAARFAGMTQAGLRPVTALVALGVEVAAEWPVFLLMLGTLVLHYVPDWKATAEQWLRRHLASDLVTIELVVLGVLVAIYLVQRFVKAGAIRHRVRRQWRVALAHLRRAPLWVQAVNAVLTAVSLAARAGAAGAPWRAMAPPARFLRHLPSSHRYCALPSGVGIKGGVSLRFAGEFGARCRCSSCGLFGGPADDPQRVPDGSLARVRRRQLVTIGWGQTLEAQERRANEPPCPGVPSAEHYWCRAIDQ